MEKGQIGILLVEDDEVDIMNIKRAFKKNNIKNPLFIANNGVEALAMLRETGDKRLDPFPKIVLSDVNMPKMNGIELLQELRKDEGLKNLSVFMLTTSNQDSDKIDAYNLNVAGYILKPLSFDKFIEAIETLYNYWKLIER